MVSSFAAEEPNTKQWVPAITTNNDIIEHGIPQISLPYIAATAQGHCRSCWHSLTTDPLAMSMWSAGSICFRGLSRTWDHRREGSNKMIRSDFLPTLMSPKHETFVRLHIVLFFNILISRHLCLLVWVRTVRWNLTIRELYFFGHVKTRKSHESYLSPDFSTSF